MGTTLLCEFRVLGLGFRAYGLGFRVEGVQVVISASWSLAGFDRVL